MLFRYSLDPSSKGRQRLPLMPMVSLEDAARKGLASSPWVWNAMGSSSIRVADVINGWLWRKDTMDRMAYFGCSVEVVDRFLYVLDGFTQSSALASM